MQNFSYSKTHCHFCSKKLEPALWSSADLICFYCKEKFGIEYLSLTGVIKLIIDKYEFAFWDQNHEMFINIDNSIDNYQLPCHPEVNQNNYLQIIEKIKELQAFA